MLKQRKPPTKVAPKTNPRTNRKPILPATVFSAALKRKHELLQKLEAAGTPRDGRLCIRRMGENEDGTVRYCGRWAIAGGTVCPKHGGNAPQVKKAAQARMLELLERKVERLNEISEQDEHLPSALGATQSLINRVLGKVGDAPKKDGGGTTIQIGVAFGGAAQPVTIGVKQLLASSDEPIEAEISTDEAE